MSSFAEQLREAAEPLAQAYEVAARNDLPLMHCYAEKVRGGTVWKFVCPHCRRQHTHSAEPGHRVAHCEEPGSPYTERGYVLVPAPKLIVESFVGYDEHSIPYRGVPELRGRTHRKTMTVVWSEGTLIDRNEFGHVIDDVAMSTALDDIWERYKPQCDQRRATFWRGNVCGSMALVPITAGMEVLSVVREHFEKALAQLPDRVV
jgi:hypothetical protein